MAEKFQIVSVVSKDKYFLVRGRAISPSGVPGVWTDWKLVLAGDTVAPGSPSAGQVVVTQVMGAFVVSVSAGYLSGRDADVRYLRWYVNEKLTDDDEGFDPGWEPVAILDPSESFIFSPDTAGDKFYDIFVVAEDISGNFLAGLNPQVSNQVVEKVSNSAIIDRDDDDDSTGIDGAVKIRKNSITVDEVLFVVVGTNNVVATINASSEGIDIEGSKILLDGDVTVTEDFTLLGDAIVSGAIESDDWGAAAGGQLDLANGTLKFGGSDDPLFSVDSSGALTSESGTIANFTIDAAEGFYAGLGATRVQMKPGLGIWLGATAIGGAPFSVNASGSMVALAGVISDFTIDTPEGLYAGSGVTRVQMKPGAGIWCGATAIGSAPFSVTNAGVLKAVSGTIGGFTLGATAQTAGALTLDAGNQLIELSDTDGYLRLDIASNIGELLIATPGDASLIQIGAVKNVGGGYHEGFVQCITRKISDDSLYGLVSMGGDFNTANLGFWNGSTGQAAFFYFYFSTQDLELQLPASSDYFDLFRGNFSVAAGQKIALEGKAGDTYLTYQNSRVEFFVNNTLEGYIDTTGFVDNGRKTKPTAIGGTAILLTNKTGAVSVAGGLVEASDSFDDAVELCAADGDHPIGVFLDGGIADGAEAWVVISGCADVAMEDNTSATHGNWVRTSVTEAGFADATNADPPGGGLINLLIHEREIGHCFESVSATGGGTHILARCKLQFN